MEIRPIAAPPTLTQLTGVADSGKSMDRDARERHTHSGRGHVADENSEDKAEEQKPSRILDELA
jgi:hypothetical protein